MHGASITGHLFFAYLQLFQPVFLPLSCFSPLPLPKRQRILTYTQSTLPRPLFLLYIKFKLKQTSNSLFTPVSILYTTAHHSLLRVILLSSHPPPTSKNVSHSYFLVIKSFPPASSPRASASPTARANA